MTDLTKAETITVADGKYIISNNNGALTVLRNGEPWNRDLSGDNLVYWMFVEIQQLRAALAAQQASQPVAFDHDIGADRYQVVKGPFWWHVRIGDSTANVGKFLTKMAAEYMALKLLTAFRDGAFMQSRAAQPVAWGQLGMLNGKTYLRMNYDRTPYPPPADVVRNLNLVPLFAAAQPQQAADELGWLIEMQFGDGLLWWSGCFDDDGTYPPSRLIARMVNDVNKAVRFSRREDAQRVLDAMLAAQPCPLLARAKTLYSVHEHMWPEAAQPQQAEGDTP